MLDQFSLVDADRLQFGDLGIFGLVLAFKPLVLLRDLLALATVVGQIAKLAINDCAHVKVVQVLRITALGPKLVLFFDYVADRLFLLFLSFHDYFTLIRIIQN